MAPRGGFNKRGGGGRGRGRGRGGGGQRHFSDNRVGFDDVVKKNEKLETFYNTINIIPEGPEREAFWAALRRTLPNSFRFTGSKGHALSVRDNLVNRYFPLIREANYDGRPVDPPTPIAWYPEKLAYRMDTPKNVIRKYEPFREFQKFLVSETGVGNISRQEEVSMIPPLVLDVQSHHTVLDLCAAPGSKSAQLIELIHAGEEERVDRAIRGAAAAHGEISEDGGRSMGMLVANDVNYRRAQMLVHQVKRLNSPNLVVTNHDATMFPSIELPPGSAARKTGKYLRFDRILADVPCSGDGTCRKNPSIWKEWTPGNGMGLYQVQVRILTRALQMLKVGGRVVYSTCSMNPMENEAVVSSAIERCGGVAAVRLVDCSDQLPELKRSPGLKDWSIMARNGQIYESWAEAQVSIGPDSKMFPGMFAPEAEEQIPLQNCWRVYPHQQDTGGFFIAALDKLSDIKAKPESKSKCGNKDWSFTRSGASAVVEEEPEPTTAGTAETAFDKLLDEVANGEHEPVTAPPTSSAYVENAPAIENSTAGVKREAEDDGPVPSSPKRVKTDLEADANETEAQVVSNGNDISTRPEIEIDITDDVDAVDGAVTQHEVEDVVMDATVDAPMGNPQEVPAEVAGNNDDARPPRSRRDNAANEESFKYLAPEHPELMSISNFYQLHPSFPRDRFLVRNPAGDPVKGIYYTSQLIKEILVKNEGRGMKFVHAGVKMFMKQDAQGQDICRWRIQTEGLPIIEGWVGENRVVRINKKKTLRKLLLEMFPKVSTDKHSDGTETGGWKDLGEAGEQIRDMGMGCCILRVEVSSDPEGFKEPITLPLWRSMCSVNLMLPKEDRRAMLMRIFNEDAELVNHSDPMQNGRAGGSKALPRASNGSVSADKAEGELQAQSKEEEMDDAEGDDDDDARVAIVT